MSVKKDDLMLVLLYANWCGHCRNFYKKDDNDKPIDLKDLPDNELTWQKVKKDCGVKTIQFEEAELKQEENVDGIELSKLNKYVEGWPTIVMLKKDGDKYKILKKFNKSRNDMNNFLDFIKECQNEKSEQKGGSVDYRKKYKKYKLMYRKLLEKQR
jgi:thiol-disulfide isomerase/thioredoxin